MKSVSTAVPSAKTSQSAFTLVELLAIAAAVLVLMGITFGVSKSVSNQQARTQARAELAMIAQALEEFKLTYGDYPVISDDDLSSNANARELTKALTGFSYLEPGTVQGTRVMTDVSLNEARKSFIDVDKFNFSEPFGNPNSPSDLDRIYLVDPWRQPYVYIYNKGSDLNAWDNVGYVLFSKGPDREIDTDAINTSTGIVGGTASDNLDNIYPNQ